MLGLISRPKNKSFDKERGTIMTRVDDNVLGKFTRQMHDVWERVMSGSLNPEEVYHVVKPLLSKKRKGGKRVKRVEEGGIVPILPSDYLKNFHGCFIRFWEEQGKSLTNGDVEFPTCTLSRYNWSIISPCGVTNQDSFDLHLGPKSKNWDDLNVLKVNEEYLKPVDKSLVVLIRPNIEPDPDGRLSYNQAVANQIPFISIGQRIRLDAFIVWMHKYNKVKAMELRLREHLDVIGWTRTCSLDPDGRVAYACWDPPVASSGFTGRLVTTRTPTAVSAGQFFLVTSSFYSFPLQKRNAPEQTVMFAMFAWELFYTDFHYLISKYKAYYIDNFDELIICLFFSNLLE